MLLQVKCQVRSVKTLGIPNLGIIFYESCDESKREQTALVLRFADNEGFIQVFFFFFFIFIMLNTLLH